MSSGTDSGGVTQSQILAQQAQTASDYGATPAQMQASQSIINLSSNETALADLNYTFAALDAQITSAPASSILLTQTASTIMTEVGYMQQMIQLLNGQLTGNTTAQAQLSTYLTTLSTILQDAEATPPVIDVTDLDTLSTMLGAMDQLVGTLPSSTQAQYLNLQQSMVNDLTTQTNQLLQLTQNQAQINSLQEDINTQMAIVSQDMGGQQLLDSLFTALAKIKSDSQQLIQLGVYTSANSPYATILNALANASGESFTANGVSVNLDQLVVTQEIKNNAATYLASNPNATLSQLQQALLGENQNDPSYQTAVENLSAFFGSGYGPAALKLGTMNSSGVVTLSTAIMYNENQLSVTSSAVYTTVSSVLINQAQINSLEADINTQMAIVSQDMSGQQLLDSLFTALAKIKSDSQQLIQLGVYTSANSPYASILNALANASGESFTANGVSVNLDQLVVTQEIKNNAATYLASNPNATLSQLQQALAAENQNDSSYQTAVADLSAFFGSGYGSAALKLGTMNSSGVVTLSTAIMYNENQLSVTSPAVYTTISSEIITIPNTPSTFESNISAALNSAVTALQQASTDLNTVITSVNTYLTTAQQAQIAASTAIQQLSDNQTALQSFLSELSSLGTMPNLGSALTSDLTTGYQTIINSLIQTSSVLAQDTTISSGQLGALNQYLSTMTAVQTALEATPPNFTTVASYASTLPTILGELDQIASTLTTSTQTTFVSNQQSLFSTLSTQANQLLTDQQTQLSAVTVTSAQTTAMSQLVSILSTMSSMSGTGATFFSDTFFQNLAQLFTLVNSPSLPASETSALQNELTTVMDMTLGVNGSTTNTLPLQNLLGLAEIKQLISTYPAADGTPNVNSSSLQIYLLTSFVPQAASYMNSNPNATYSQLYSYLQTLTPLGGVQNFYINAVNNLSALFGTGFDFNNAVLKLGTSASNGNITLSSSSIYALNNLEVPTSSPTLYSQITSWAQSALSVATSEVSTLATDQATATALTASITQTQTLIPQLSSATTQLASVAAAVAQAASSSSSSGGGSGGGSSSGGSSSGSGTTSLSSNLQEAFYQAILTHYMPGQEAYLNQQATNLDYSNWVATQYNTLMGDTSSYQSASSIFTFSSSLTSPTTGSYITFWGQVYSWTNYQGSVASATAQVSNELNSCNTAITDAQQALSDINTILAALTPPGNSDTSQFLTNPDLATQISTLQTTLKTEQSNLEAGLASLQKLQMVLQSITIVPAVTYSAGTNATGTSEKNDWNSWNLEVPPAATSTSGFAVQINPPTTISPQDAAYIQANWQQLLSQGENAVTQGTTANPNSGLSQIAQDFNTQSQNAANQSQTQQMQLQLVMTEIQQEWTVVSTALQILNQAMMTLAKAIFSL